MNEPIAPLFSDFALNKQLLDAVADAGYETPTPIQQQAIPLISAGHDVLGIAQTGTGKTAAYLLPLLMKVKYSQGFNPRAVILAPTRELVMQIHEAAVQLAANTDLRMVVLYGGIGPKTQIENIQNGCDLVIATPGRLQDLYLRGVLVLKDLKTLVLDEADKMMDMGFMPQIRALLEVIPRKRQNLLFSATMPPKVLSLCEEFLEDPVKVEVSPEKMAAETVDQWVFETPNIGTKLQLLKHFMNQEDIFLRVIVFAKTKTSADAILHHLEGKMKGIIRVIHGNKGQNSRINAMEAFKDGTVRLLIATDVAARGLDVPAVSHVINFDVPVIYEDYVHRIGRTGRAKAVGTAITFVQPADEWHLAKVEKLIRQKPQRLKLPEAINPTATPFAEQQEQLMELDRQHRVDDPTFQGAFHEKKVTFKPKTKKPGSRAASSVFKSSSKPKGGKPSGNKGRSSGKR